MTAVLITVDTELSFGAHQRGMSGQDNYDRYIEGKGGGAAVGLAHQLNVLRRHRVKAVFFVEALFARVLGINLLKRVVDPILADGHEVQLHVHTEWLYAFESDPVNGRRGINLFDFPEDDQVALIEIAAEALVRAGAKPPTAFRAGNFGANEDTLRALQRVGIGMDSSLNEAAGAQSPLAFGTIDRQLPTQALPGVVEVPVTCFSDRPGGSRPLQICAVSSAEMAHVLRLCARQGQACAVVVSHSFELMNASRDAPSALIVDRFERLCRLLDSERSVLPSAGFDDLDRDVLLGSARARLRSNVTRTAGRVVEQALERLR